MVMKILNYFNLRTFLAITFSVFSAFLTLHFQIKLHIDLLLFGLCVVFPLNFSLQAAFKRREKALEYFSFFKARCLAIHFTFQACKELSAEKKQSARVLVKSVATKLADQLEAGHPGFQAMQQQLDEIMDFAQSNRKEIGGRLMVRIIRYMSDVSNSAAYLISLITHRTMTGLRFYSIFFIFLFPFVQGPMLYDRLGDVLPAWALYVIMAITSLALVTLNNFQYLIERPFNQKGFDSIKVREFLLEIKD